MCVWRFVHRYDMIILLVHGVMDSDAPSTWVPLRPQLGRRRLEACLRLLSKHYRFVSLDDAVDMITGRTCVRPYSLVLTFDDGYRNNIKYALPMLRRYGVPATFFLVTGHIEHRKPLWFDRLDYALQQVPVDGREVQIGQQTIRLRASTRAALRASYKGLRDAAKALSGPDTEMLQQIEDMAAGLEAESGRKLADIFENDDWAAVLTWEEIRAAAGRDVSFGSHTVDHLRLGLVDAEIVRDQLIRSKEMIEARVGQPCRHLCYPDGSFAQQVTEIARACGYVSAVTTIEDVNRVGDDPMSLCRINLSESGSITETLAEVCGLSHSISRLTTRPWAALSRRGKTRAPRT